MTNSMRFILLFAIFFVGAAANRKHEDYAMHPWRGDACRPGEFQTKLAHFLGGEEEFLDRPLMKVPTIDGTTGGSSVYSHAQAHYDSDRLAAGMRVLLRKISMTHSTSSRSDNVTRIALALGIETTYKHLITRMAINKNAHSIVDLTRFLTHSNFAQIFDITNPSIVIVESTTYNLHYSLFERLLMENKGLQIFSIDKSRDGSLPYLFDFANEYDNKGPIYTPLNFPLNQEMQLIFTSGSTGIPSIVSRSFCVLMREDMLSYQDYFTTNDTFLLTEGLSSGFYNFFILHGASFASVSLDAQNEKESEKNEALLTEEVFLKMNVTVICGPPVWIDLIAEVLDDDLNEDEQQQATEPVRAIYTYGSHVPLPVQDRISRVFSYSRIINQYGLTETGKIGETDFKECTLEISKGVEVKIVRSDGEQNGEVKVRSNYMMRGYVTSAGLEMPFDEDGWFSTGDVGHLDQRGRLMLIGRTRPSINYLGQELDPTEVSNFWKDTFHNEGIEIEEMALVRDLNHFHSGQTAVLFCRVKREALEGDFNPNSYAEIVSRTGSKIELGAIMQQYSYWGTSVICFVNDFPRVGRGKVNTIELERLHAKHIKPVVILEGQRDQQDSFNGDTSDTHMIVVTLKWSTNTHNSKFEINHMEWQEIEKKMIGSIKDDEL